MFTTLIYSSPNILRAQGILRNLPNMYDGLFSTEPCVPLVYSELEAYSETYQISMLENFTHHLVQPQYIQNRGIFRIQGIFRILPNIYQEIFYSKPCVTLTYSEPLVYAELWYIVKSKHIQNPGEYLRWSILSRTLCNNSRFRGPTYSKILNIQNRCVSATP